MSCVCPHCGVEFDPSVPSDFVQPLSPANGTVKISMYTVSFRRDLWQSIGGSALYRFVAFKMKNDRIYFRFYKERPDNLSDDYFTYQVQTTGNLRASVQASRFLSYQQRRVSYGWNGIFPVHTMVVEGDSPVYGIARRERRGLQNGDWGGRCRPGEF